jgi:hypothetical protein
MGEGGRPLTQVVPASPFPRYPFQHIEEIDTTRIAGLRLPAAAIGALAALPFLVLELVNRREFGEGFHVALFVLLWMLPAGIVGMTRSIIRRRRPGAAGMALRVSLVGLFAWLWVGLLIDQMPCFLGVPNCD